MADRQTMTVDLGALHACEQAAQTPQQGRQAYLLWCMAQDVGWEATRARFARRTWFRHLALLRRVGLAVPSDAEARCSPKTPWGALSPGQLFGLVGRDFQLLTPWGERSARTGQPFYPTGSAGTVHQVVFRDGGWRVGVVMAPVPCEYLERPVGRFLAETAPVAADRAAASAAAPAAVPVSQAEAGTSA